MSDTGTEDPVRAIRNALDRIGALVALGVFDLEHLRAEEALVDMALRSIAYRDRQAARALRSALVVWCFDRHPGGDGADGETFVLCRDAAQELDPAFQVPEKWRRGG